MSEYDAIEEGPVTIKFFKSNNNRVRFNIDVDFAKTDCDPHKASDLFSTIVGLLRSSLGVKLPKCR